MSFKIIGIGEVLWDMLPSGSQVGGAPGNFACHARALGADACVVSRVGNDALGKSIFEYLRDRGIADSTMQLDKESPTGVVSVALSKDGIPSYDIRKNAAWDRLEAAPAALEAVRRADAVCFGSLAQRSQPSRSSIQSLVAAASPSALRVFDVNLRQNYYSREILEQSFALANVLKLNDEELGLISEMICLTGSMKHQVERLAGNYGLQWVALTRGSKGSLLYHNQSWSECAPPAVQISDTVGAGDAFTAAMVMGILSKMASEEINQVANEVAGYVCTCAGATPPLPKIFLQRFAARNGVASKPVSQRSRGGLKSLDL